MSAQLSFLPCVEMALRKVSQVGKDCIPFSICAGGLDFFPAGEDGLAGKFEFVILGGSLAGGEVG